MMMIRSARGAERNKFERPNQEKNRWSEWDWCYNNLGIFFGISRAPLSEFGKIEPGPDPERRRIH
jgi:hypothetical protein